jgi:hypothetical protein
MRWIELVVTAPQERDEQLEEGILEEFRTVSPRRRRSRWRMFGIDLSVPGGWDIQRAEAKPGELTMSFRNGVGEARVNRTKGTDAWFDGDLAAYLTSHARCRRESVATAEYGGHQACVAQSKEKGVRLQWLVGARRLRRDLAWHCTTTQSVYQVTLHAARGAEYTPRDFRVRCCEESGKVA